MKSNIISTCSNCIDNCTPIETRSLEKTITFITFNNTNQGPVKCISVHLLTIIDHIRSVQQKFFKETSEYLIS